MSEKRFAVRVWPQGSAPYFYSWHTSAAQAKRIARQAFGRTVHKVRVSVFDRLGDARDPDPIIDTWT